MSRFVIAVCGGRHYADRERVYSELDQIAARYGGANLYVIEGGADGADRWARAWRAARLIAGRTFRADWERDGKAAGPIRNRKLLIEGDPDILLAFPGGRGTDDMLRQAAALKVTIVEIAGRASP